MRISDWSSDVCSSDLSSGGLPVESDTASEFPPLPELVTWTREVIFLPRSRISAAASEPYIERVGHRSTDESFAFNRAKSSIAKAEPARQSVGRLVGDVVDRAAGGILAEQNALRTFQYLNTLHVQTDPDAGQRGEAERRLVDINANRRRCRQSGIEIADATQREHRGAECRPRIGQTRDGLGQILDAADTLLDELIDTDRRNREADLVDRFSALAGGEAEIAVTHQNEEHTSEL